MARSINRLSALEVKRVSAKGLYPDGAGLYLQVSSTGSKSWVYRYQINKRPRMVGLGSTLVTSLAEAREKAMALRKLVAKDIDPLDQREADAKAAAAELSRQVTFRDCAAKYIEAHQGEWKSEKHAKQWASTLRMYAEPDFGDLPVGQVDTALVTKALEAIWYDKRETAERVRGRIESILDWAAVRGYREGENPARWRGHLDHILPRKGKTASHHSALAYADVPAFYNLLLDQVGVSAIALRFTILTAARTGEVVGAMWPEIDPAGSTWTIPAERMKAGRKHLVPLSKQGCRLIADLKDLRTSAAAPIFGLSNMAMLQLLKRMDRTDVTVHGFRSAFKDWATEKTDYGRDVSEMALAHTIGDKVEAAYRRGELLEKRAKLMQEWADYCCGPPTTGQESSQAS